MLWKAWIYWVCFLKWLSHVYFWACFCVKNQINLEVILYKLLLTKEACIQLSKQLAQIVTSRNYKTLVFRQTRNWTTSNTISNYSKKFLECSTTENRNRGKILNTRWWNYYKKMGCNLLHPIFTILSLNYCFTKIWDFVSQPSLQVAKIE